MIVNQNLSKLSYGAGEKQSQEIIIKNVRNLFKLKKENEAIKDRMIRDIRTLIEKEEKDYKPMRVGNFWNNYIEYKNSGDRDKNLSVKEYLDRIKPQLRDIITHFQKSDAWKIQLMIAINYISSNDVNEECVMHWKGDKIECVTYNANEIFNELFDSLFPR